MKEIEKDLMVKDHKIMTAMTATSIREMVSQANEVGVKKEDIVSLFNRDGQYILVYYR